MDHKKGTYHSILKATSIFGGVQVFSILITIIRGKFVAILLGTAGMGLNGLFMSGINLIKSLTSLGIPESAVKELSVAYASGDEQRMAQTFSVFRNWIWFTACLGLVITLIFASTLSISAFGDDSQTTAFRWLSINFVFTALTGGVYTYLRGTRQIKHLAKATVLGSFFGLLTSIPLFYWLGKEGVVPSIVVSAATTYLISLYFARKVQIPKAKLTFKQTFDLGKPMVLLGLNLSMSTLLGFLVTYVLSAFIVQKGNLSDLGLYNAGVTIITGYVGMVFTAIGTDYYPRLAGLVHDESKWKGLVQQQGELVLIILGVVVLLLMVSVQILIKVLLSDEFLTSADYIMWSVFALPLKGIVWVQGFVLIAKGENKIFLTTEIISNATILILNLVFYSWMGITGLGISMVISYISAQLMMVIVLKKYFNFSLSWDVYRLLLVIFVFMAGIMLVHLQNPAFGIWIKLGTAMLGSLYLGWELHKKINLTETFSTVLAKFKK